MDENAAVQTPATDEVVEAIEEKSPSPRELMEQAYDRASQEADEPAQNAAPEPVEKPEPAVEVPTDLPGGVKQYWKDIPESAREAILKSQREMSSKLSQASRDVQALGPIRDVVYKAAREIPEVAAMKPQEIASQMWSLIQAGQALQKDPEAAFLGLAKQHNIDLAKLAGQPQGQQAQQDAQTINALRQELARVNDQLRQVADPNYIRQQFDTFQTETTVAQDVTKFAETHEHWATVEPELPKYIQAVKAITPDAAPAEVLQEAYNMAVQRLVPDARAQAPGAGGEPAPQPPQRVAQAVKAKSVNVSSKPGGKPKPDNPRDLMGAVWDKMMND